MDTSKEYIKMCRRAKEIQDFYFKVEDMRPNLPSFIWDERMQRICLHLWIPSRLAKELSLQIPHLAISTEWENDGNIRIEESEAPYSETAIWLPRQDQLQEMAGDYTDVWYEITGSCGIWATEQEDHEIYKYCHWTQFSSMEQFWLAYVMKKKYDKVWDGSDWKLLLRRKYNANLQ